MIEELIKQSIMLKYNNISYTFAIDINGNLVIEL